MFKEVKIVCLECGEERCWLGFETGWDDVIQSALMAMRCTHPVLTMEAKL